MLLHPYTLALLLCALGFLFSETENLQLKTQNFAPGCPTRRLALSLEGLCVWVLGFSFPLTLLHFCTLTLLLCADCRVPHTPSGPACPDLRGEPRRVLRVGLGLAFVARALRPRLGVAFVALPLIPAPEARHNLAQPVRAGNSRPKGTERRRRDTSPFPGGMSTEPAFPRIT